MSESEWTFIACFCWLCIERHCNRILSVVYRVSPWGSWSEKNILVKHLLAFHFHWITEIILLNLQRITTHSNCLHFSSPASAYLCLQVPRAILGSIIGFCFWLLLSSSALTALAAGQILALCPLIDLILTSSWWDRKIDHFSPPHSAEIERVKMEECSKQNTHTIKNVKMSQK